MSNEGGSVFAQFVAEIPEKQHAEAEIVRRGPQPIIPLAHARSSPAEKLLSWIVNCWPRPVLTLRDIQAFGPRSVRDPMDAVSLTQKLTAYGWLIPEKAWRRDQQKWRIIREPSKAPTAPERQTPRPTTWTTA